VSINEDAAHNKILDCTNTTKFNKLDESRRTELEGHMPHFRLPGNKQKREVRKWAVQYYWLSVVTAATTVRLISINEGNYILTICLPQNLALCGHIYMV
jgi:hypothetical protein